MAPQRHICASTHSRLWPARIASRRSYGTIAPLVRQTVLIVDDHAAFREATSSLIEAEGFRVVGEAANGEEAIRAVALLRPDVVLLDIQLPRLDGLEVAERLAARPDPPAIVLISSRSAAAYGRRLQRSPAKGFIPKRVLSGQAIAALLTL